MGGLDTSPVGCSFSLKTKIGYKKEKWKSNTWE